MLVLGWVVGPFVVGCLDACVCVRFFVLEGERHVESFGTDCGFCAWDDPGRGFGWSGCRERWELWLPGVS